MGENENVSHSSHVQKLFETQNGLSSHRLLCHDFPGKNTLQEVQKCNRPGTKPEKGSLPGYQPVSAGINPRKRVVGAISWPHADCPMDLSYAGTLIHSGFRRRSIRVQATLFVRRENTAGDRACHPQVAVIPSDVFYLNNLHPLRTCILYPGLTTLLLM